jgi:hypothetical protein
VEEAAYLVRKRDFISYRVAKKIDCRVDKRVNWWLEEPLSSREEALYL